MQGRGPPGFFWGYGPGDLLFSFLGVIILCFGFKASRRWPAPCTPSGLLRGVLYRAQGPALLSAYVPAQRRTRHKAHAACRCMSSGPSWRGTAPRS